MSLASTLESLERTLIGLHADPAAECSGLTKALAALYEETVELDGFAEIADLTAAASGLLAGLLEGGEEQPLNEAVLGFLDELLSCVGKLAAGEKLSDLQIPALPELGEVMDDEAVDPEMFEMFISSCMGFLNDIEAQALEIEQVEDPQESLSAMRRVVHTLKGESGVMSLDVLQRLCHEAESMMDRCLERAAHFPVDAVLALVDWTKQYVELLHADPKAEPRPHQELLDLLMRTPEAEAAEAPRTDVATADAPDAEVGMVEADDGAAVAAAGPDITADAPAGDGRVSLEVDPDFADSVGDFIVESTAHLSEAEAAMLEMEGGNSDPEQINLSFRAFHTIKGVAGFLGLSSVVDLAHHSETLMDKCRSGELEFRNEEIDLVLQSVDLIGSMLRAMQGDAEPPFLADVEAHNQKLARAVEGGPATGEPEATVQLESAQPESTQPEPTQPEPIQPEANPAEALSPPPAAPPQASAAPAAGAPPIPAQAPRAAEPSKPVSRPAEGKSPVKPGARRTKIDSTIKVNTARLDALVDMVGELVIGQTMVLQDPALLSLDNQTLQRNIAQVGKITRDLQESAMSLRMVTLKSTFQKMSRLVRDVSAKSGKKVNLIIVGEDTELDRNVVEEIGDPLVHMLRNAVDHGIETPDERRAVGKADAGELLLKAYHQGGSIVIELKDDGRGLNREKILAKATERGLISPDDNPDEFTDAQVFNMIFQPGFSTAEKVTDLSGRGVGMDVVRRNIEALRGKVEIDSVPGNGSVFSMRLPLTLAIIDGMIVRVGEARYVIPTHAIEQSFRANPDDVHYMQDTGEMVKVRGKVLPIFRLKEILEQQSGLDSLEEGILVVLEAGERRCCLLVDEILGQQQVVIKSLGVSTARIPGVSGGAIMGDGRVALIIDVGGLMEEATAELV